jgi:hypothetical protein
MKSNDDDDTDAKQASSREHQLHLTQPNGTSTNNSEGTTAPPSIASEPTRLLDHKNDEELRLDCELKALRSMRIALLSTLRMLEAARDDLHHYQGHHVDQLTKASERVRAAFSQLKEQLGQ